MLPGSQVVARALTRTRTLTVCKFIAVWASFGSLGYHFGYFWGPGGQQSGVSYFPVQVYVQNVLPSTTTDPFPPQESAESGVVSGLVIDACRSGLYERAARASRITNILVPCSL